jgi:hypothetical protein
MRQNGIAVFMFQENGGEADNQTAVTLKLRAQNEPQ